MSRLRVAVIGMGPIGQCHADIYRADALAELVGVCDVREDRAQAAGERLGVPAFTDGRQMLRSLAPDVCGIATGGVEYGSDHYEPTMWALEAGCHVLGEKPICNQIDKAREMVRLARDRHRCYGINFNHRFTEAAYRARRWLDEGRLGHLLFVNVAIWIANPVETSPWFHFKALHPHSVDLMRHFCGEIEQVHCFATRAPGRSIWSTAHFSMKFRNGVVGGLTGSYDIARGHPMERCEVAGTAGRFVIDDMWREATLYPAGDLEKRVYTNPTFGGHRDFQQTFANRIHRFLEQVARGDRPEQIDGSGADGLAAQLVLDAAVRSVETGSVIRLPPEETP